MSRTVWPALTAVDFQSHDHIAERVLPFIEDERGNGVYGYGHWEKSEFACAVNEYDRQRSSSLDVGGEYSCSDVVHVWAVVIDPESQRFSWSDVTADCPNAFPVTLIHR